MGLDTDRLSYHGPVKQFEIAMDYARHFCGTIKFRGSSGDEWLEVEFIGEPTNVLNIYPSGAERSIGLASPPRNADNIVAATDYLFFRDEKSRGYKVHYHPRIDIQTKILLEAEKGRK